MTLLASSLVSCQCRPSSFFFFFFLMIRRPPRSTLFPTRRSSDLHLVRARQGPARRAVIEGRRGPGDGVVACRAVGRRKRSEEHTSELQSQSNLVCRLLLEKKKKTQHNCL